MRQFMTVRLIRLYPLYLWALMLALIVAIGSVARGTLKLTDVGAYALFGILFMPLPIGVSLFPPNGPVWSLFLELCANAIFALLGKRLTTPFLSIFGGAASCVLMAAVYYAMVRLWG